MYTAPKAILSIGIRVSRDAALAEAEGAASRS
jgi:hypothetical protein